MKEETATPRSMPCIVCPNGCRLQVESAADGSLTVTGNLCNKGIDFAKAEITNPIRGLTTTVRTSFPGVPALPVRTAGEIPKGKILDVMQLLKTITIDQPLGVGETAVKDVLALGVDIIVTSNVLKELTNVEAT
jgi:CxxC motif-containing protein